MAFKGPFQTNLFYNSMTTSLIHYTVKMTYCSPNPFLVLSLSSRKTDLLTHRRNSVKQQRDLCRNTQEMLAGDASKHMSRLLHKENGNKFHSYRAENSHSLRNMSDLAFRATNRPSCLKPIGGSEGF